jgi:hypothetical protein
MEWITSGLSVQATKGTLTNVVVSPYDNTSILEYVSIYNVSFKTTSSIDTTKSI